MELIDFYSKRVDQFQKSSNKYHRLANLLSIARLLLFIVIPFAFVLLFNISLWLSIIVTIILLALFGLSIKRHFNYQQEEKVSDFISRINQNEIKSVRGELKDFYGGTEFKPKDHKYASDLDVFGESSLFALVNRSTTWPGQKKVSEWLLNQTDIETVFNRQKAIKELSDLIDFRQKLQSFVIKTPDLGSNPTSILEWINEPNLIKKPHQLTLLISLFSLFSLSGIVLAIAGYGFGLLTLSLICNIFIGFKLIKEVNKTHEKLSRAGNYLKMYSKIIGFIKEHKFQSKLLSDYSDCFFKGEHSANYSIKRLAKILDRFDLRLNAMIGIPLNFLFFWDLWQLLSLERWKNKHGNDIPKWFDTLGEFEAISSFANLAFNNKNWAYPVIVKNDFVFNAKDLGHPLISQNKRVSNVMNFTGSGKMLLITGSNMSGKSTFLRTIGINMILAGAGSPVCASNCEVSLRTPFTSMRIADSLEENISTFYAELKRISEVIQSVDNKESVILLLDEVLRGTNSNDRHKGALALLRQLVNTGAVGVMATHDLELADQELISKGMIEPFFFDVQVNGDELFFDYKLHKGKCTTLNASILMKKMGIRLDYFDKIK
ncbi:MAG: hypothetical protein AB9846_09610 [Tenuifilaceae bacterium]